MLCDANLTTTLHYLFDSMKPLWRSLLFLTSAVFGVQPTLALSSYNEEAAYDVSSRDKIILDYDESDNESYEQNTAFESSDNLNELSVYMSDSADAFYDETEENNVLSALERANNSRRLRKKRPSPRRNVAVPEKNRKQKKQKQRVSRREKLNVNSKSLMNGSSLAAKPLTRNNNAHSLPNHHLFGHKQPQNQDVQYVTLPDHFRVHNHSPLPKIKEPKTQTTLPPRPNEGHHNNIITPWVRHFLTHTCPHDGLLAVPRDYCLDNFNLTQLPAVVERIAQRALENEPQSALPATQSSSSSYPLYRAALRLLTDTTVDWNSIPDYLQQAATALYLLIHQRYLVSPRGLDAVRRRLSTFGACPRHDCHGMPLLPVGDSDNYSCSDSLSKAKRYCARCRQVYVHRESQVDGCAWGTSFCHLFWMVHGAEVMTKTDETAISGVVSETSYVPRIFGFRVHPSSFAR